MLQLGAEKLAAQESLRREYDSRGGLEKLLQSYKDEVETLKEALQIAAEAVAEAELRAGESSHLTSVPGDASVASMAPLVAADTSWETPESDNAYGGYAYAAQVEHDDAESGYEETAQDDYTEFYNTEQTTETAAEAEELLPVTETPAKTGEEEGGDGDIEEQRAAEEAAAVDEFQDAFEDPLSS